MRRARGPLAAMVLTIVGACHGVPADDRQEIAALRLTYVPIPQGIRCLLLALSRHVARAPRDVTADAVWRFDGPTGATMSSAGMVQATQTGEVGITAEYRSRRARADAWLAPNARGEMLGTVRGYVYVDQNFVLHPLGRARVEVMSGRNVGRWTTTAADGSYALSRLRPGQTRIRATEPAHVTTEEDVDILAGENRQNLLMGHPAIPDLSKGPARRLTL